MNGMRKVEAPTIHPSIIKLLSLATSKEKVEIEYENYINFRNRTLFAFELEGETVGGIGVEISSLNLCEIKHIAVSSEQRGKGIGSKMIGFILEMYTSVSAETDSDAVEFYRKNGFKITSLGEKYPGVERFLCEFYREFFCMEKMKIVELVHFSMDYETELNSFELPEEQEQFTALPKKITKVADGQYRIVILSEHVPVGFFLLHASERVKEYSDNPRAMLLTAFSINHAHQGKGYAKQGMSLIYGFVQKEFPDCNEIVLAVNHKNIPAQKLYMKVGFQDTGRRKVGRIGEQFIMALSL
jgi:ribosomal protein S18 acetylase RimI-like enzyme